jgi:short-chain fatty acids transporter
MNESQNTAPDASAVSPRRGVVTGLVYLFEQVMPDPFVLSICLTLLVILLSLGLAPHGTLPEILAAWYGGTFNILGFALQMILILATGYAIADAPVIQAGLRATAAVVQTPTKAALVVFPIVAIASWLNWGLGLVVGALLAREIANA